jgi:hypothetical protein
LNGLFHSSTAAYKESSSISCLLELRISTAVYSIYNFAAA